MIFLPNEPFHFALASNMVKARESRPVMFSWLNEVVMDSEDAACIASIASGDQRALAELYARYRPRLYRYLWHQLGGDGALIEEVLQDTFLAIWRAADTFRGDSRVATWIFRVAQRCAGRSQRSAPRNGKGRIVSLADLREDEGSPLLNGHEDQSLTRIALQEALLRLTGKHREVILLVFVQGFTGDEAAQILGVPPGTVKSRLHAARALLASDPALQHIEGVSS
jgi:RNA polymerase sigma-70 factor, ECF subfamily